MPDRRARPQLQSLVRQRYLIGGVAAALHATVALFVLSASACSNSASPGDSGNIVPVEGVKVTPQVIQFPAIGETRQLVATISPANATDRAVVWASTDSAVASVDAVGLVTAKAAGSGVFITVYTHDGGHQASANVSVNPQELARPPDASAVGRSQAAPDRFEP